MDGRPKVETVNSSSLIFIRLARLIEVRGAQFSGSRDHYCLAAITCSNRGRNLAPGYELSKGYSSEW